MESSEVDFVSAICFVKRGVAKERPDKITLTPQEFATVIKDIKDEAGSGSDEDEDEEAMETSDNENENENGAGSNETGDSSVAPDDEFNFANYEEEGAEQVAGINDIAVLDENEHIPDEEDSEDEDDVIKPTDNILLMGVVKDESASMVAYVFNEEESSFYVHHDFLLPAYPLCIEWLSHDPGSDKDGNMCAIGSMNSIISVWDLDIEHPIEPAFRLGSKGSRKKNKPQVGHKDAVLTLSWNSNFNHILASGSVDKTVLLWDLDEGKPHTTIKAVKSQVQSVAFNPVEAQTLLVGSADGVVRLFDCREPDNVDTNFKSWKLDSDVEKVLWNPLDSNYCVAGTNAGFLHYVDVRASDPLWTKQAHSEELSGLAFNPELKHFMATSSTDGMFKIWKFNNNDLTPVYSTELNIGRIHCMTTCPDNPFLFAFGGDSKTNNHFLINVKNYQPVRTIFELAEE